LSRAVYEWGFLGFSSLSILCLGYWVVSIANAKSDINLAFRKVDVSVARGSIAVRSDRYWTLQNLSAYAGTQFGSSGPITDLGWSLPGSGFGWRMVREPGTGFFVWVLEMSILIPFLANGVLAAWCLRRYRAVRQQQTASSEKLISVLD
jgi:hypothetical protein